MIGVGRLAEQRDRLGPQAVGRFEKPHHGSDAVIVLDVLYQRPAHEHLEALKPAQARVSGGEACGYQCC